VDIPLTAKQERFVHKFMIDFSVAKAARRSGYSPRTARVIASENLLKPNIKKALDAARLDLSQRTALNATWVEQRLMHVVENCLAPQPVLDRDGEPTGRHTFDSQGALRDLEILAKRLQLFTEKQPEQEPDPSAVSFTLQRRLQALAAKVRTQEQTPNVPDDAPLGDPPLDPPPDDAPPDDAPDPAPPLDPPDDAPPLKTARARLIERSLSPGQPPRSCSQCGTSFRPQRNEPHCCFACRCRSEGKVHRREHTDDCHCYIASDPLTSPQ
jgi:phage terminase small subunit